jgi:acetoacetyl-CoA synthetase
MMWNWLIAALAAEATVVLYDGAPLHEDGTILWRLAQETEVNVFGTNAKYLSALESEEISVRTQFPLPHLDRILSTGSPLVPASFDFIHREIKPNVQISSISGGTDILGCFALGAPTEPVRRGELQVRSLGLAVDVYSEQGVSIRNELGELVCTKPFPSTPIGFVNDPDGSRFHAAYFSRFPGVWHHGDFAELCDSGGMRIVGRSDATLNPGGIRIGTAEIYQQVERIPGIAEALAVTFTRSPDAKFVLFLRLKDAAMDQEALFRQVRTTLRSNLSPFHVPWKLLAAPDFPRTRNGKLMELVVRSLLAGEAIKNLEAIANPECLDFFRQVGDDLAHAERLGA